MLLRGVVILFKLSGGQVGAETVIFLDLFGVDQTAIILPTEMCSTTLVFSVLLKKKKKRIYIMLKMCRLWDS